MVMGQRRVSEHLHFFLFITMSGKQEKRARQNLKRNFLSAAILRVYSVRKKVTNLIVFYRLEIYNSSLSHTSYDCELVTITHCYVGEFLSYPHLDFCRYCKGQKQSPPDPSSFQDSMRPLLFGDGFFALVLLLQSLFVCYWLAVSVFKLYCNHGHGNDCTQPQVSSSIPSLLS